MRGSLSISGVVGALLSGEDKSGENDIDGTVDASLSGVRRKEPSIASEITEYKK